ncbi:DUF1549 domain-containing protein [Planctomycetes bacterium K23_9]|uniref:Protein containing DUF1549 n=1 Tax=Stieleria marina TaxID=1930275 RepID=A0A517P0Y1_9BACT|nr:hypothetical protein K239x_50460 [Planctomycetes bacterium K23_9]
MAHFKSGLAGLLRWSWFVLLVFLAFSYLVAGLSTTSGVADRQPIIDSPDPIAADSASGSGDTSVSSESAQADSFEEAVAKVDQAWLASIQTKELTPAPVADWLTICRRMSLALVGNGLSLEEIRQLEQLPEEQREDAHLDTLLNDSRHHHYWGERWARFLVGTDEGQFVLYRRRRFRIWLADVFAQNWRYDEIVRNLITAEGLWTDSPEVNFLSATFDSNDGQPDPVRLAARTSRAFLGLRIDCLQCHDDFLGNVSLGDTQSPRDGRQTDFHQLAAFFTSAKTSGLQGVQDGKPDYQYKYLDAEEETDVQPAVPYSPELLPEEGRPRVRLAKWITHPENRQAARAAVSHVWALMYGRSAVDSVDNLPLDESTTPVLESLTDDFVENKFDLRRLVRLITRSAAFRVDSRADFEVTPKHERLGAVFPLVRLRPEQMAGAIIQSSRIKSIDRESSLLVQLQKFGGTNDFIKRYGDVGEDEFNSESVTITQRLVMLNGNMLKESVDYNPVLNASSHIEMFSKDNSHAVDTVYLCVLNRHPTDAEQEHFVHRIEEAKNRASAIEDLFWVLLNSTELAWNH